MSAMQGEPPPLTGISAAVARLHQLEPVEVAFANQLDSTGETFVLDHFRGARTDSLQGLVSPRDAGLGGRCISLGRPVVVTDYVAARGITHQYDLPVTSEGLRAMFALPIRRDGRVHGVVYGAVRRPLAFSDRLLNAAVAAVEQTSITQPADAFEDVTGPPGTDTLATTGEQLQELRAELRTIAAGCADPELRSRLLRLADPLARPADKANGCKLTPRELDVLAAIAVGCANAEVAHRLGLSVETIKSYLKSAMTKLGSHNRLEAVYRARCHGLLP